MADVDALKSAFRPFKVDGLPSSGENEPDKGEIQAGIDGLQAGFDSLAGAITDAGMVVPFATQADRDADLNHAAGTWALVFADSDPTKNGYSQKVGASGAGSWSFKGPAPGKAYVDAALAAAADAATSRAAAQTSADDADTSRQILADGIELTTEPVGINHPMLVTPLAEVIVDPVGYPATGTDGEGALFAAVLKILDTIKLNPVGGGIDFNGSRLEVVESQYSYAIADEAGYPIFAILGNQVLGGGGGSSPVDDADAAAKAHTLRVSQRVVTTVQTPSATYNVQYVYGQSLGQGDETWPALSITNRFGNLQLGGNVLATTNGPVFTPFDDANFHPLVAQAVSGATKYSEAQEATFTEPDGSKRAEPINHGFANGSKFYLNQLRLTENDTGRTYVSINIARSGATIGQLSKNHYEGTVGSGGEFYGAYTSSMGLAKTAAGTSAICVTAIGYLQGESNYYVLGIATTELTYATYKPRLAQVCADMQTDAMTSMGQSLPPAFLIYQTGAAFTRDQDINGLDGLHIGMAQLDFALASPTAWMVGPYYPYVDKGGHLSPNGSRHLGHQFAKVFHRIVVKRQGWEPLRPLKIWMPDAHTILIAYHVPAPPLVFDLPYVVAAATSYSDKGFRVKDTSGIVGISDVSIVRDTVIQITLARDAVGVPNIWYADQTTHNGNGMVRDSDPAVSPLDTYEYQPSKGMTSTYNITALVGKPYALWNWCVAWYLPANYSEI